MEILKVEHLTKVYGEGETATRALDDVSFSVEVVGNLSRSSDRLDRASRRFCI